MSTLLRSAGPSLRALPPTVRRASAAFLVALAAVLSGACPASGDDVKPPSDRFIFPSGLAVAPDESVLFAVSANSELRYDSGSIVVVDLDLVDNLIDAWLPDRDQVPNGGDGGDSCFRDPERGDILRCPARNAIADTNAGARVGNFATSLTVQSLDSGDLRLLVPVRGDPSLTWLDYTGGELTCGGSEAVPLCDEEHRLVSLRGDPELPSLVAEPFQIFVDGPGGFAMMSHLQTAAATLVSTPSNGDPPVLEDSLLGLFAGNNFGVQSATGVAGRPRIGDDGGTSYDFVYMISSSENRVQMLSVYDQTQGAPQMVSVGNFFLDAVEPSNDSRGMVFSADGDRAFVVNRNPPVLHILDTSDDADGVPQNRDLGHVELCLDPGNIVWADLSEDDIPYERVYISCFDDGQVWVIDPDNRRIERIIEAGVGMHALAVAPERRRLFAADYSDDTVAVIDITPGGDNENRLVLRLGRGR